MGTLLLSPTSSTSLAPLPALSVALAFQPPSRLSSRLSLPSALVRPLSQPQSLSLLRSSPLSCASPSRWSRPAFPSHSPSSRSLLSSPASPTLEKRALAGESLIQEIGQLPTVFRKVEFEPVACKSRVLRPLPSAHRAHPQ